MQKREGYIHLSDPSRAFLDRTGDDINLDKSKVHDVKTLPITEERLSEMRSLTEEDKALQQLKRVIMMGWPESKDKLHGLVGPYFPYRDEITLQEGIIFCGERVIVPTKMRGKVMETLHTPHLGEESKCHVLPNMSTEMPLEQPDRQFQKVAVDLFEWDKKMFKILVDYHSGFF